MAEPGAPDLRALAAMSARVGGDIALVQGAGGNSSVKIDGVLWVRSSGAWLSDATVGPNFVPVDIAAARRAIVDGIETISALASPSTTAGLRLSIETSLHALMPHRVVLHVHGVNTIAWSALADGAEGLAARLDGLRWNFLPYCRPGVPLSRALAPVVERERPDLLVLGNHGLVVGAAGEAAAEALAREVERRLELPARTCAAADLARLESLSAGSVYRPAAHADSHATALDSWGLSVASAGSLCPDHVVFLGPAAYVLGDGETPAGVAARAAQAGVAAPASILVSGAGALIRRGLSPGAEAMLRCLGLVTARLPVGAAVRHLAGADEEALLDWDAERYRRALAR